MAYVSSVDAEHLLHRNIISVGDCLVQRGEEVRPLKPNAADEIGFGDTSAEVYVLLAEFVVVADSCVKCLFAPCTPSQVRDGIVRSVAVNVVYLCSVLGIGNECTSDEQVYLVVLLLTTIESKTDRVAYIVALLLAPTRFQYETRTHIPHIPEI